MGVMNKIKSLSYHLHNPIIHERLWVFKKFYAFARANARKRNNFTNI